MLIDIITAFPDLVKAPLEESIIRLARQAGAVTIRVHDLRDWTTDRHKTIDDTPYGGGAGMVYKVEPLDACLSDLLAEEENLKTRILLTSPRGPVFTQEQAVKLALIERVILICGHYKGVDQRILELHPIEEMSIGDYILSGGELAALVITDAITRMLPGAIGDINSAMSDSFSDDLLDCEYYTRPEEYKGLRVPDVLLSGNHEKIENWRQQRREEITQERRPELFKKYLKK